VVVVVGDRRLDVDALEQRRVQVRDVGAGSEDLVELLDLADPQRRRDVVVAIVVAEPAVLEPRARLEPPLVPQRDEAARLRARRSSSQRPPSPVVICLFG
jgi:hypothetical protein